jgi:hypothetical protein
MKHVKLFEDFLNESLSKGPLVDGIEKIMDSGIGIKKAFDQMKKSGLLMWSPAKGLKVQDYGFDDFLIRIKITTEAGYTSINVWEPKNVEKAKEIHQKEHGFPLDTDKDALIAESDKFAIYRGQWESTKAIARTFKLRDFPPLSDSGDSGLSGDEADAKWEPVLDAFGVSSLDDLVWLGEYFPEIAAKEGKSVDSFSLDSFGDKDPHGDVDFSIYKWKGMLLGRHDDDYRYYATLCKAKDALKLAKLLQNEEDIDIY